MTGQSLMFVGLITHWNSYRNPHLYIYMYCFNGVVRGLYRVWRFRLSITKSLFGLWNLVACCLRKRNSLKARCSNSKGSDDGVNTVKRNSLTGMEV